MASRAFGGFTYRDRIEVGFYGELSRAVNGAGNELRILHVDRNLGRLAGFSEALARFGGALGVLEHEHIVATRTLGRTPEGVLLVVTAAVDRPLSMERLLEAGPPPPEVALALGLAVADALAIVHARGLIHGRVHPRSLLVDAAGTALLDHFAVGRALALAAAHAGDPDPGGQFSGYLAPELASGGAPTAAGDVFGAGAILYALYGGDPQGGAQAGRIKATTSLRRAISRAMDPDPGNRFRDGGELREALTQAATADACLRAATAAVARWLGDTRMRVGDDGAEVSGVDDLIAALPRPGAPADLDGLLDELDNETSGGQAAAVHAARAAIDSEQITSIQDEPSDIGDISGLTHVDDPVGDDRDPISELIALGAPRPIPDQPSSRLRLDSDGDDEHTPLPPPTPHGEGSVTRQGDEVLAGTGRRRILEQAAQEAIAELEEEEQEDREPKPRKLAPVAPRAPSQLTAHVPPLKRGIPGWIWLLLTLGALGGMFWLIWTQTDVLHPERARARKRQQEAEDRAKEVRLRSEQQRGAHITIGADVAGAAVWMRLGDTPLDSMKLPSYMPHQIRLLRDGYRHQDVIVVAADWTGETALIRRTLERRAQADPPAKAWPPDLPPGVEQGFAGTGRGVIRVESVPPAAEVWLLVGYTNDVDMNDFPAGERYEFRVQKDGYEPEKLIIEPAEWRDDSSMEPGAMVTEMSRSVTLQEIPANPKKSK